MLSNRSNKYLINVQYMRSFIRIDSNLPLHVNSWWFHLIVSLLVSASKAAQLGRAAPAPFEAPTSKPESAVSPPARAQVTWPGRIIYQQIRSRGGHMTPNVQRDSERVATEAGPSRGLQPKWRRGPASSSVVARARSRA